jgi:predicted Zn-dependent peptidase
MKKPIRALFAAAGVAALLSSSTSRADEPPKLNVPFEKYTLDNGLTVILHEDHALPLVTVNLMYKVGSRFEEAHRTGFAHLFEHLMFMGTHRVPTKKFDAWMESEGGWNNAWTSEDRTDYYDVGPAHILPLLLWLEADRLSSLGQDMTKEKLDAQRDVVRNERRQTSENTPYGKVELVLPELLFGDTHPYHHPVIGSHEDLEAASVDDVKSFFSRWYVPNNASLVVAGDFSSTEVKELVKQRFGWIPKGNVPAAPTVTQSKLTSVVRKEIVDNVNLAKVIFAWRSPATFAPGDAELDLVAQILHKGKASRLYKTLVYDKALAQEVNAGQGSLDLDGYFTIEAIARPGVDLTKLEAAMEDEIKKITSKPVADAELKRAQNDFETAFVSRLQAINERASILNRYEMAKGDPGYADKDLQRYRAATTASLLATAKSTLDLNARVVLRVVPKDAPKAEPKAKTKTAKKGKK